jgi:hypothetical protein
LLAEARDKQIPQDIVVVNHEYGSKAFHLMNQMRPYTAEACRPKANKVATMPIRTTNLNSAVAKLFFRTGGKYFRRSASPRLCGSNQDPSGLRFLCFLAADSLCEGKKCVPVQEALRQMGGCLFSGSGSVCVHLWLNFLLVRVSAPLRLNQGFLSRARR